MSLKRVRRRRKLRKCGSQRKQVLETDISRVSIKQGTQLKKSCRGPLQGCYSALVRRDRFPYGPPERNV